MIKPVQGAPLKFTKKIGIFLNNQVPHIILKAPIIGTIETIAPSPTLTIAILRMACIDLGEALCRTDYLANFKELTAKKQFSNLFALLADGIRLIKKR